MADQQRARTPWGLIVAAGVAALAVLSTIYFFSPRPASLGARATGIAPPGCILDAGGSIGGPISLVDEARRPVTQASFDHGMTLVYFGYTFCPDVCPLSLQMERAALADLGSIRSRVKPVMISLDPERDTPAVIGAYVKSDGFAPGLIGLTGTQAQVAAAAKAFKVPWQKIPDPSSAAGYTIGHGSFFYLMDDKWRLRALFPSSMKPADAAQCIGAAIAADTHN